MSNRSMVLPLPTFNSVVIDMVRFEIELHTPALNIQPALVYVDWVVAHRGSAVLLRAPGVPFQAAVRNDPQAAP